VANEADADRSGLWQDPLAAETSRAWPGWQPSAGLLISPQADAIHYSVNNKGATRAEPMAGAQGTESQRSMLPTMLGSLITQPTIA
jgi:hypothetical protein